MAVEGRLAAAKEIISLCRSILDLASDAKLGKYNCVKVSERYKSDAKTLLTKVESYKRVTGNYEVLDTHVRILEDVKYVVTKEQTRLERLDTKINGTCCCSWAWWSIWGWDRILLPEKYEKIMKDALNHLKEIDELVKTEEGTRKTCELLAQGQPFNGDGRYVSIQQSVFDDLCKAIETDSQTVVLLHGGVGKAKTSLARWVFHHYQNGKTGRLTAFESCGSNFELTFQSGGPSHIELAHRIMNKILVQLMPAYRPSDPSRIQRDYKSFLNATKENYKVLIVLDDVSNAEFLHEMCKAAEDSKSVTYLVTTQIPDLCVTARVSSHTRSIKVGISEDAKAGFEDKVIPTQHETTATETIPVTEGNPLALACATATLPSNDVDRTNVTNKWWSEAPLTVGDKLNQREHLGLELEHRSRRSFWAATENSMECVKWCIEAKVRAKVLLFLIYSCSAGASVPEEVLAFWYERLTKAIPDCKSFLSKLGARELLKGPTSVGGLTSYKAGESPTCNAWSLAPLAELYMDYHMATDKGETMKKDIKEKMETLLVVKSNDQPEANGKSEEDIEKAKVAKALLGLYFDDQTDKSAVELVKSTAQRARSEWKTKKFDEASLHRRRKAMEPIIWLFSQTDEKWTTLNGPSIARKVFIRYIYEDELDGDSVSSLLAWEVDYRPVQFATLVALLSILAVEESPLSCRDSEGIMDALEQLARSGLVSLSGVSIPISFKEALVPNLESLMTSSQYDKPLRDQLARTMRELFVTENPATPVC